MEQLTSSPQFRRRIVVIKRLLQMKYVLLVLLTVLLTVTVISLDFYYVVGKVFLEKLSEGDSIAIVKSASKLLALHFSIYIFIVLIVSVFISHRFAGPIFRLERISEAVSKGDLTVRAFFRTGDELFETAEYMNKMVDSLKEKIILERSQCSNLSGRIKVVSEQLQMAKTTPDGAVKELEAIGMEIKNISAEFKI